MKKKRENSSKALKNNCEKKRKKTLTVITIMILNFKLN